MTTLREEEQGGPRARARVTPARRGEDGETTPARKGNPRSPFADGDQWRDRARRVAQCSPWRDRPASLAEIEAHTRAGGWVPGDWPWWVELPGWIYGYGIALPVHAVSYAVLWVIQRPGRLLVVCFVAALLWVAFQVG